MPARRRPTSRPWSRRSSESDRPLGGDGPTDRRRDREPDRLPRPRPRFGAGRHRPGGEHRRGGGQPLGVGSRHRCGPGGPDGRGGAIGPVRRPGPGERRSERRQRRREPGRHRSRCRRLRLEPNPTTGTEPSASRGSSRPIRCGRRRATTSTLCGMQDAYSIHAATLGEIDPMTLYRLLALRVDVFVVEQNCAYRELDGRDLETDAVQVWAQAVDGAPIATLRLLREVDGSARIGRVATAASARSAGIAARLMEHALDLADGRRGGARRAGSARGLVRPVRLHPGRARTSTRTASRICRCAAPRVIIFTIHLTERVRRSDIGSDFAQLRWLYTRCDLTNRTQNVTCANIFSSLRFGLLEGLATISGEPSPGRKALCTSRRSVVRGSHPSREPRTTCRVLRVA